MVSALEQIIADVRRHLPVLERSLPLNHAGIAPQPLSDAVARFERLRGEAAPPQALATLAGMPKRIKQTCADLLHVEPDEIAITRNTAEGINLIAQGFDWKAGDKLLTTSVEYPSNVYPWQNLTGRGIEIVTVPERDGRIELDELIDAIDDRTRMVAISHVQFSSGFAIDLSRLAAACHERDVFVLADIAQSIGALPVDLSQVDAAAWPTWKWLLGPVGMGGLYLARRHHDTIRPVFVGVEGMQPTADYLDYRFELRAGAERFEYSTQNVLGLIGIDEAMRTQAAIMQTGEDAHAAVAKRILSVCDELIDQLGRRDYKLFSSTRVGERSGIVCFDTPVDAVALVQHLRREGVDVACRAGRLRVSPHFYSTADDIHRFVAKLAEVENALRST